MTADSYHMTRPDLEEAREAIDRLYGRDSPQMWRTLLSRAGLTGREQDRAAVEKIVAVMKAADPVTALCGRSLEIRLRTYEYLVAAAEIIKADQERSA